MISLQNKNNTTAPEINPPERFRLISIDSSFRRPGFAVFDVSLEKIQLIKLLSIDNKTGKDAKEKSTGQILEEIYAGFTKLVNETDDPVLFAREKAFNGRGSMNEIKIFEALGVIDYVIYQSKGQLIEIYPNSLKKLITGDGKADKKRIAEAMVDYVGEVAYANDDESDAAAVGIAALIHLGRIKKSESEEPPIA